ncbi:transmembrane amino acid transporter protein-domain-containing protein [Radiomyces spectabilis]|uniref:transmembrane amino acid transporter protein-domain-containing protein n=1 Tax=Radiomyces spectabilis TaxID=64574 RepID=UPI00221E4669|nr:transmembrane amino acid transporter protein-domain-containing protein [Radiomyces spectabilis]KAI8391589.1 transmembrane amino acid transporter protein-domain-containing protein [Radiomyces spectabilis]
MASYGVVTPPPERPLTQAERDLLQSDRPGYGSCSVVEVSFNLVNATVGAGIIGLPFAVYHAGFFIGIAVSVIVAILSQLGLYMLIRAGQRTNIYKFAMLVEYLMGRPGYHFLNFIVFFQAAGACVSYFILVGDTIPVLLTLYFPQYSIFANRSLVIAVISYVFILPLNLSRSIGALARWSILSVLCLPVILLTMLIRAPVYAPEHRAPLTWVGSDIFGALGIMAFAFACSQVAFDNFRSQKDQSSSGWAKSTTLATIMSWFVSMAFAVLGYLSFGVDVQPNLFLNFPNDDPIVNIGRFALGFSMLLTIPMGFYPTREAVQKSLGFETADRQPTKMQHYIVTFVLFTVITAAGIAIRSIGQVYAIVGGFAATTLAYILPAASYLVTRRAVPLEDEAAKKPLLAHDPPTDAASSSSSTSSSSPLPSPSAKDNVAWSDESGTGRAGALMTTRWSWLDMAAVLLIIWGFMVMIFSVSGALRSSK